MTQQDPMFGTAADDGFDVVLLFGPYRLYPVQRRLERSGEAVPIGSRALDILVVLVREAGSVINKRILMTKAWKNIVVDESNLRVNIGLLRRILGEGESGSSYVANIPGRGYSFVAKVTRLDSMSRLELATERRRLIAAVPALGPAQLVGRETDLDLLASAILDHRCVSIVGPGGIGKSTVAMACAQRLIDEYSAEVHCLNLDSLAQPHSLVRSLMGALGIEQDGSDPVSAITRRLAGASTVLVFDNCDESLGEVSTLVEALCEHGAELHALVTSREALRVNGEFTYRLSSLDVPPKGMLLTVVEARAFSAIELFIGKCMATASLCEFTDEDVPRIAEICSRLDANPLAITLVASRVVTFGLAGTQALLNSSCRLYWSGRRNAISRHQTLKAMLDCSFNALSGDEQQLLYRLSAFGGRFSLADIQAMSDKMPDFAALVGLLDALVGKSVLMPQATPSGVMEFRMFESVRIFLLEKVLKGETRKREASYCESQQGSLRRQGSVG